jgi:hypothetical protein
MLTTADLNQFTGTESYHQFNWLYRNFVATDGAIYVAKEGGAYWLLEAIASHIATNAKLRVGMLAEIQFWKLRSRTLKSGPNKGQKRWELSCHADSDMPPVVTQKIEHSDFPLDSIDLWVAPSQMGDRKVWVIYLPSEH